ncbi:MAG: hypothetical protein AAFY02_02165 [Pseudomonadota bacterium]
MRRCILHIGGLKTGSSALQQVFMENAGRLRQAGLLYPLCGETTGSQRNLFYELTRHRLFDPEQPTLAWLERQVRESEEEEVLILSSEMFSTLGRFSRVPRRLVRLLQGWGLEVQVLLYLRPQDELLNSLYAQRVRLLNCKQRFADWAPSALKESIFHYGRLLQRWETAAPSALLLRPYNRETKDRGILADFLEATGLADRLDAATLSSGPALRNPTPGPLTVEVFYRLARAGGRRRYRRQLHALRRFVTAAADERGWNDRAFAGMTEALRAEVTRQFAADNAKVAQAYLPDSWDAVFAEDLQRPLSVNLFGPRTASAEEEAAIQDLVSIAEARFGAAATTG